MDRNIKMSHLKQFGTDVSLPLSNISRSFIAYTAVGVSRTDFGYGADTYRNSGSVLLDS